MRHKMFTHRFFPLPFVAALCLLLNSCQQSTSPNPNTQWYTQSFPSSVGSTWQYIIYDTTFAPGGKFQSARTESLLVVVIQVDSISQTERLARWVYAYSDTADTATVTLTPTTVSITHAFNVFDSYSKLSKQNAEYVFPLIVGKGWGSTYSNGGDTSTVVGVTYVTVPSGTFGDASHILSLNYTIGPVSYFDVDSWFVPNIGFVQFQESEAYDANSEKVYVELVSYELHS